MRPGLDDLVQAAFNGRKRLVKRFMKNRFNARRITEPTEAMLRRANASIAALAAASKGVTA